MNMTKVANKALNSSFWRKLAPDNPTDIAAKIALASTTTKDAMNCYYYTVQSYNNEKIPEDKRKFVAAMDFVNGVLNVSIQLLMGTIVERKSASLFDKMFGKHFTEEAAKKYLEKAKNEVKSKNLPKDFSLDQIKDRLKVNQKWGKAGFKVLAVLFITQVFCKRVITPLIATPVASVLKNKLEKYEKEHAPKDNQDVKNNTDKNKASQPFHLLYTQGSAIPTVTGDAGAHKAFKSFEHIV